jgi:putative modified peptide
MADTVLPKAQAVALLQKLSTDDQFRASYMANPLKALESIGVPTNDLPKSMPALTTLADKLVFAHAFAQVEANQAEVTCCLHPPTIKLQLGH